MIKPVQREGEHTLNRGASASIHSTGHFEGRVSMTSCHHLSLPSFHGTSLRLAASLWSKTTTCFTACPSFSVRSRASSTMVCRQVRQSLTGGSCTRTMPNVTRAAEQMPPVNPGSAGWSHHVDMQGYICTKAGWKHCAAIHVCVQVCV